MKKVLVADDTKNIRLLLTKCLEMEGYEVKSANDGFEATDLLLKESFDLAFIDIKMPNLSGTEVIRTIRGRGIRTPVIVITAYGTVRNAVECTQLGAVAYLQKPFTADKIRTVLKEYQDGTPEGISSVGIPPEGISSVGIPSEGTPSVSKPSEGIPSVGRPLEVIPSVDGPGSGASRELVRELVGKQEYARALQALEPILSGLITDPEAYLLLSKIYGGLGNKELERKFQRIFVLLSEP